MIRRKFMARLHMKSGKTITTYVNDLTLTKRGNELVGLAYPGDKILDYVSLDDIEAITTRKSWTRWRWK